jgi:hypothetical protein
MRAMKKERERERERRRENLFGAGNEREFDIARNELFQLGRTSSETHTHPSSSFSSIFIVWLLLFYCVVSALCLSNLAHHIVLLTVRPTKKSEKSAIWKVKLLYLRITVITDT